MTTTLSGWSGIYRWANGQRVSDYGSSLLRDIAVPGTKKKVLLRVEVAPVFAAALAQVNQHVIALNPGPLDGYEYRDARTGAGLSNHAGGIAADFRYDVWTAEHKQFATADQIRTMHAILDHFRTTGGKRIFGWGGDWGANYTDDMHLEIGQAWEPGIGSFVSVADVLNVQKRLGIDNNGNITKTPVIPSPSKPHPVLAVPPFPGAFKIGAHGPYVKAIQLGLNAAGYKLVTDGQFGAQTNSCLVAWEKKNPKYGKADGIVGPMTYKALAKPV